MEAGVALNGLHDKFQLIGADPLAVIPALFPPLQQVIGAVGAGLAAALDLIGLLADMAADHAVDLRHFFEDSGPFLLEGR